MNHKQQADYWEGEFKGARQRLFAPLDDQNKTWLDDQNKTLAWLDSYCMFCYSQYLVLLTLSKFQERV